MHRACYTSIVDFCLRLIHAQQMRKYCARNIPKACAYNVKRLTCSVFARLVNKSASFRPHILCLFGYFRFVDVRRHSKSLYLHTLYASVQFKKSGTNERMQKNSLSKQLVVSRNVVVFAKNTQMKGKICHMQCKRNKNYVKLRNSQK